MIYDSRFTISQKPARSAVANRQSSIINHQSRQGVALIVTLIMLAVITFMATTFLVLSRRERNSVSTNTDQTTARFTADTALERAKAQLLSGIIAYTNDQNFDLMVPTNFFNPLGYDSAAVDFRTNVNYNYDKNGNPLGLPEQQQNIANLLYDPRAPVYITNAKVTNDFRYYLDLNRNGLFDDSGLIPNLTYINGILVTNPINPVIGAVGDPQWIGVLRYPDRPHSADNQFVSRWTYLIQPVGKTLDVNYLHNYAKRLNNTMTAGAGDGFTRNEGVGTWEINLAAFLTDLNTNVWQPNTAPYNYATDPSGLPSLTSANTGAAFDDALSLLRYRYNSDYRNLQPANLLLGSSPAATTLLLANDRIDEYADGPIMATTALPLSDFNVASLPWSGADNVNHYFTTQDYFDPNKSSTFFANNLLGVGMRPDTYDRYTFYRMLAQLGTDSAPPVEDKINVNYRNTVNGVVVPGMATNLIAWTPLDFFTNSAARMFEKLNLRDNNGNLITVTNIPIWPTTNNNFYTPAVHRVLQLAANIYEATTNSLYPCIYRPHFLALGSPIATNIIINGYELVNGSDTLATPTAALSPPLDLNIAADRAKAEIVPAPNYYGVPWIIGAKKGLPNLNKIAFETIPQITRKIQITRPVVSTGYENGWSAKQMYVINVTNVLGVQLWNSYNQIYPRAVYIQTDGNMSVQITNDLGYNPPVVSHAFGGTAIGAGATNMLAGQWPARLKPGRSGTISAQSFVVPLATNVWVIPDSYAVANNLYDVRTSPDGNQFWNAPGLNLTDLRQPVWQFTTYNNLRCVVFDGGPSGRVIDYVQLRLEVPAMNLTTNALRNDPLGVWDTTLNNKAYWRGLPLGVIKQIQIALNPSSVGTDQWAEDPAKSRADQSSGFFKFMTEATYPITTWQVPFSPTSKQPQPYPWQANDPLVHYLADDLTPPKIATALVAAAPNTVHTLVTDKLTESYNERYTPWGGKPTKPGEYPAYVTALKDPYVSAPDLWNFPTNRLPSIGWLGRVHRGTPWQTVYMKSSDILSMDLTTWQAWSGSSNPLLATNIAPIVDRQLFEIFTASLNDNATRGQLSINQTNLAAWSAVLSGVVVLTNDPVRTTATKTAAYGFDIIQPAGIYNPSVLPLPPFVQLVQGIQDAHTNYPNQTFANLGDFLATPALTDLSPFLDTPANPISASLSLLNAGGITDEVLERIPQQIMSLLTISHSPRFVAYVYGQTLHPANNSVLIGGAFNGLCTNYQVTAETAARAVIRVDGGPVNPHVVVEQYNVLPPD